MRAARTQESQTGAGTALQPTEIFVPCIPRDPIFGGLNRFGFQGSLPSSSQDTWGKLQGESEGWKVAGIPSRVFQHFSAPCLTARFLTLRAERAQNSLPGQNTRDFPLFSESAPKKGWETGK